MGKLVFAGVGYRNRNWGDVLKMKQKNKELKTLKDLYLKAEDMRKARCFLEAELKELIKAEAVKWVKDFERIKELSKDDDYKSEYYFGELDGKINFIKHFFNLTEEDLK